MSLKSYDKKSILNFISQNDSLNRLYSFPVAEHQGNVYLLKNIEFECNLLSTDNSDENNFDNLNNLNKTEYEFQFKYFINFNNSGLKKGLDIWYISNFIFDKWKQSLELLFPKQEFLIALDLKKYDLESEACLLFYAIRDGVTLINPVESMFFDQSEKYKFSNNPKRIEIVRKCG